MPAHLVLPKSRDAVAGARLRGSSNGRRSNRLRILNGLKSSFLRFMRTTNVSESVANEKVDIDLTCSPTVVLPASESFRPYWRGMSESDGP